MAQDRGGNIHRRHGGRQRPYGGAGPQKQNPQGRFRARQDAPRESWERGGRFGDEPRERPLRRWPEAFGMHEEDRGHHAGLPQRSPSREPGGFAGRGPKGYRRSDERIREDVCDRLTLCDDVDASDVTVAVQDGEVTLEGSVRDRRMRRDAESCADEVMGVREIHNRLQTRATAGAGQPESV
jgi:hypothetical protein